MQWFGSRFAARSPGNPDVQFQLGSEPSLGPNWAGELQPEAPGSPPALPLSQSSMGMCTAPGTLAAPELNTSLALAQEARAVKQQPFNSQHAAHKLLAQSFSTRCALEGRAGAAMNIPRQQQLYQGLLSLEVPASEVLNWALQEKLALVRPRPEPPRQDLAPDGPDPRMFFEPQQLLTETPHLGPEGLGPLPLPQPHIRPLSAVFLMYRKFQQWDL
ncbi:protein phosphatase 1 regulatory subunit 35 isoform A [Alligator mississippiensis]|uniref:Protein phosphatase 1 regulatory subunit 35 isoform A n=1 Tax=Alligator mississippiensis TaxID=8496 RepID=A0A151PJ55_ALLMI|nr:protein phosphatase 1 regulatory subunit 35 isoform A [Alligator mississippiensis]